MKNLELSGQRFGKLFVIGQDEKNKYNTSGALLWKCQCDCGNICYKTTASLKRPIASKNSVKACSKKCGASVPLGTQSERLTVIEVIFQTNAETKLRCRCECGNEVLVSQGHFKNKTVKSCGCFREETMSLIGKKYANSVDITGMKFGNLTAIHPTDKRQNKSVVWECKCECGNSHYASVANLKGGSVIHCSNCKINSKGEAKIEALLKSNNIPYTKEKTFENCKNPKTDRLLRFDFYVNNFYLIEFDGIQHTISNEKGWNTNVNLKQVQERDNIKNEWCKKNQIPLIRIPYTELDYLTIEDLKLKSTKFLMK